MTLADDYKQAASALVDDLVESGSWLRNEVSACDYGVLDKSTNCPIVIQPETTNWQFLTFDAYDADIGLRVKVYVRDDGNPVTTLTRVWDACGTVASAVIGGSNLGSNNRTARLDSVERPDDIYVNMKGYDFLPVYATVRVLKEVP